MAQLRYKGETRRDKTRWDDRLPASDRYYWTRIRSQRLPWASWTAHQAEYSEVPGGPWRLLSESSSLQPHYLHRRVKAFL